MEHKKEPAEIVVNRPTGPRITVSEPVSLGQLVVNKTRQSIRLAATLSVAIPLFLIKHKYISGVTVSTLTAVSIHTAIMLMMGVGGDKKPTASAFCSQGTTVIGRMSGLNATEQQAIAGDLVCGLVTDGVITGDMGTGGCGSPIDAIYFYSTSSTANARINLCGTAFTATDGGGMLFTADQGYTSPGTASGFLNSGYNPSLQSSQCGNGAAACSYTTNSSMYGVYVTTSRTSNADTAAMGANDGTNTSQLLPKDQANVNILNGTGTTIGATPNTDVKGMTIFTRINATTTGQIIYQFGSGGPFSVTSTSTIPTTIPNRVIYSGARNNQGTADLWLLDQMGGIIIGGSVNSTVATQICTRFNNAIRTISTGLSGYASCT